MIATPARITAIYRYPVKGLTPQALPGAELSIGQTLAGDRSYAIENGRSGFDAAMPAYLPKSRFLMLMRNERLARLAVQFNDDSGLLIVAVGGREAVRGDLNTAQGRAAIERFMSGFCADELRGPPRILHAPGHSFSDVARKVVSIINLASVADIENVLRAAVNPLRFRANFYIAGWPAWHEFDLVGRNVTIGTARLRIVKRIQRCAATNVDPDTGIRDLAIPAMLERRYGHGDCGLYAEVIGDGRAGIGDAVLACS